MPTVKLESKTITKKTGSNTAKSSTTFRRNGKIVATQETRIILK